MTVPSCDDLWDDILVLVAGVDNLAMSRGG